MISKIQIHKLVLTSCTNFHLEYLYTKADKRDALSACLICISNCIVYAHGTLADNRNCPKGAILDHCPPETRPSYT